MVLCCTIHRQSTSDNLTLPDTGIDLDSLTTYAPRNAQTWFATLRSPQPLPL